ERDVERFLEPARGRASLQLHDAHERLLGRLDRLGLEDLGHQIAQQVLERDEARGAAELIEHEGEVAAAALHFQHQVGGPRRPETTAMPPAEARAPGSAPESRAARVVRREGSRAGMNGASARPTRSSHGTARATIGSAQRRPTTRGTRYAALTNSGTPTAIVKTPRNVGVA